MTMTPWLSILKRLRSLGLEEADLDEHFVRSGGKGGQNVNKVSSCVVLRHRPSGLVVRCEEERSQAQNRLRARERLADRFEKRRNDQIALARHKIEKEKRQAKHRTRAAKERMLKTKHHRATLKKSRGTRNWSDGD